MWLPTRFLFEEVWISSTQSDFMSCHFSQLSSSLVEVEEFCASGWCWGSRAGTTLAGRDLCQLDLPWPRHHGSLISSLPPVQLWQKALPRHKTVRTCTENPRWRIHQRTIKHKERISKIDGHLFLGIMCRMWHVFLSHGTDSGRISEFFVYLC